MVKSISIQELQAAISKGHTVGLNCYTPVTNFLKNLEIVLKSILSFYERQDLIPAIFSVVQEMVNFTCVSNMRSIYYADKNYRLDNIDKFLQYEPEFLKSLSARVDSYYRDELVKNKMMVQALLEHNDVSLTVKIANLSSEQLDHEFYIRDYLKSAMTYDNILQYFNDHPEDPQGKNMGLAFSLILLKESGLRPELMRVSKSGTGAFSRIEIPFVDNYSSIRDRILRDESIVPFEKPNLIPPEFREKFEERQRLLKNNGILPVQ